MLCFAALSFSLGAWVSQQKIAQQIAANDARIAELHDQMARSVLEARQARMPRPTGTGLAGEIPAAAATDSTSHGTLVEEIKRQLQSEMGLLPASVLRELRKSFVEVNSYDSSGNLRYGTAGYLGNGYFITVKHGVMALKQHPDDNRKIVSIKINYNNKQVPATVVDSGDADVEVHPGDWAILRVRTKIDLPPLKTDTEYPFDFAEPIFRLGNDYSKGVILSSGYVGRRMENGLVTSLTDGHPGVSGGGVLNQHGKLVGIPIGRMDGDFRFSFILPLRQEMFRKVKVPAV